MKIKRFIAPDMRQAIKLVREEHGADAVILSNRKVANGIEIISAIDYDEGEVENMVSDQAYATINDIKDQANKLNTSSRANESLASPVSPQLNRAATIPNKANAIEQTNKPVQIVNNSVKSDALIQDKLNATNTDFNANSSQQVTAQAEYEQESYKHSSNLDAQGESVISHHRDLEVLAMQRELETLKGLLNSQFSHPSHMGFGQIHPSHNGIFTRLQEMGICSELCHEILQQLPLSSDVNDSWRKALALFAHKIQVPNEDILEKGGVVALLGSTGVGKTTTLAKLAVRYALKHGRDKVAIISVDSYRIAAQEQILSYGRMTGIPVFFAADVKTLKTTLADLYDKQLVLIDTAGVSPRDDRVDRQVELLNAIPRQIITYLVLSASTHESSLNQIAQMYSALSLSACCLSKLDEAVSIGGLLSVVIKYRLPVAYITEGQKVPEDLQKARSYNLVSKAVMLMQKSDLITKSNKAFFGNNEERHNAYAS